MHKKESALQLVLQQKMLPLYYHESLEVSTAILRALYDAGIRTIEYTNRGVKALENFAGLKKISAAEMPGMQLGIGTIKNRQQAEQYIAAGADYIVCPSTNEEVAKV